MNAPHRPMDSSAVSPNAMAQDDLHRLVDGRWTAVEASALEARLLDDPAAAATREAWQAQRGQLRSLYPQLRTDPVPQTLLDAVQRTEDARAEVDQWWRWGGIAAGVLLAFGLGWFSRGMAPAAVRPGLVLAHGNAGTFAHQAVVAHAVYAPEVRHPVEVAAAQQEHLVQWLSKRLGRPLKLPQLGAQGYELVGGRLLPGDAGARAQFMYQDAAGARITLYLGAINAPGSTAPAAMAKETAFSFVSDGPVPGFYWVDQGFGYALAGPLPREVLLQLAQAVYQQLEPAPTPAK